MGKLFSKNIRYTIGYGKTKVLSIKNLHKKVGGHLEMNTFTLYHKHKAYFIYTIRRSENDWECILI